MTRPALLAAALLSLALAGVARGQQVRPIEERLQERWRWRPLSIPGREPGFTAVRPWCEGGLVAVDEDGLIGFDGYTWTRPPGWEKYRASGLRALIPSSDGIMAVTPDSIMSISNDGELRELCKELEPLRMAGPCRLPDGETLVGAGRRIWRTTVLGRVPVGVAPEGASALIGLGCDGRGTLVCATELGFARRTGEGWEPLPVSPPPGVRGDDRTLTLPFGDGLLFVPTVLDEQSLAYHWDGQQMHAFRDPDRALLVSDAVTTPEGELILALREPELRVWRGGTWHSVVLPQPTTDAVQSLCLLAGHRLAVVYVSGRMAVCDLESRRWEAHDPSGAGLSPLVNALAPSARGGIWVGTHHGIARWDGARFTDAWLEAGDTHVDLSRITGMAEDSRGRLWVGSGSGFPGALCLDGDRWTLHDEPDGIGARCVHAISAGDGELWFMLLGGADGTRRDGGLVRLRGDTFTPFTTRTDGTTIPRSYSTCQLPDGRRLAGTLGDVFELQDGGWSSLHPPLGVGSRAFTLYCDREGVLWVGLGRPNSGVLTLSHDGWALHDQDDLSRVAAACFSETTDGKLWMTSDSGLYLLESADRYEIGGDMLPQRNFWQVVSDGSGGLWLATLGRGLVHFFPDDVDQPQTTSLGVSYSEEREPVVRWTGVDAWNDTLEDQLAFHVTVDDLPWPRNQPASAVTRQHELRISGLEPGRHRVRVQAVDNLGNVEPHGSDKSFDVDASIWTSLPMLGAMATVAGVLAWLTLVIVHRRLERAQAQRQQRELAQRLTALTLRLLSSQEVERRNLSRELHDDLGQLLTTIRVDVQHAQQLPDGDRRAAALDRALDATRRTLDRTHAISAMLRPPVLDDHGLPQAVETALSEFTQRTGVDVHSEVQLDGQAVPEMVSGHIYRVLQEALTNIQRHAQATMVDVAVAARDGQIELVVRDDGAGFVPESVPEGRRFGLLGMRERAELMGGSFRLQSAPGAGTMVRVSIPAAPRPDGEARP